MALEEKILRCETQLTTVKSNKWAEMFDNTGQVNIFIMEFKIHNGIGGKTLKWINSFLYFIQQQVIANGVKLDGPKDMHSWSFADINLGFSSMIMFVTMK